MDADKVTLGKWMEKWLDVYIQPNVQPSTYEWYERIFRVHIRPALGNVPIRKLQGIAIQSMLADLQRGRPMPENATPAQKKEAAPKSARTIKAVYDVLSMSLRVAVEQGILRKSPTDGVALPQLRKEEKSPLTTEEWDALLTEAQKEPDLFTALVLEWATGLRRGELLALKWEDFDEKAGRIFIRRAVQIRKGGPVLTQPKTVASVRDLPLPKEAVDVLKVHRKAQKEDRLAAGPNWQDAGLVFPTSVGPCGIHATGQSDLPGSPMLPG